MSRVSNNLIGILNFLTLLLSIPILGAGIWLAHKGSTDCERFLEKPVIIIGVFLLLVSLAGLIGACFRVSWLLWVYLLVMFLLIVLLFCFTIFAFVVTNSGAGRTLSNRGYKEYKLGDYSNWLQKRVSDGKNWNKIKSCLIDGKVCNSMASTNATTPTVTEFYSEHLSAIQSGCCKPADECNFEYVGPTVWTTPTAVRRVLMEVKQSPAPVTKRERKLPLNKLNIAVTVNVGFLNLEFINGHRIENKGYSVDVFKAAVDTLYPPLKFEYEFKYYPINNGSQDIDYLLGEVYKKNIDAVVGDTTISAARYYVDFTLPYSDPGIAMVVPRTSKLIFKQNFFIYLKPFAPELWGAIVGVVISTLLFLLVLHRIQNDNAQSLWQHLKTQMTSIFGNGDSPLDFRTILVVVIVGVIVTPMMVSVYAGSFSSHIAYHQNEKVDLNSKDVYIGYQFGSIIVEDLLLRKLKIDESRLKGYKSLKDYDTALSKGSAKGGVSAIIDETPYLKVFLAKYGSKYKFDGRSYKSKGFAFAFPFDSPLASHVSKGITNIEENGKMEAIEWKHFGVRDYQENESSSAYQVQWIHFGGLFISMGFLFIAIFLTTSWVRYFAIFSYGWLVLTLTKWKQWLKARIQLVKGLCFLVLSIVVGSWF